MSRNQQTDEVVASLDAPQSGSHLNRRSFLIGTTALFASVPLVTSLDACAGSAGSSAGSSGGTVNFQTSAGVRFGIPNKALIAEYQKTQSKVQVNMTVMPVQNYFPKLSTEIASKMSDLDIFTTITNLLYPAAQAGNIVALEDVIPKDILADLVADIPSHYLDTWRWKGKLYALPNDSNAQWSFYRTDLFEQAGVTLPKTWDDAPAAAKALTKDGVYGYAASLRRGEYAGAHFSSTFFSNGGEWYDPDFNPTINSDAGTRAIEVMLALMPYADPSSINAGEDDTAQVLASGTAAWAPLEWGRSDLTDPKRTPLAPKIGTSVPPDGTKPASPCLGGQAYAIASWSKKQKEALDYIIYATSSKAMRTFVGNAGQPARSSALTDSANVKIDPYFPTLQKVLAQGHPFPPIPESYPMLVELGNHVADILTKSVSPRQGLQSANDAFAKMLKQGSYLK